MRSILIDLIVAVQMPIPRTSELRNFLKEKVPEYMVPSAFVFLEAMPLTPNGKLDYNALPALDQSSHELGERYVAPRTLVEELIAEIWAEVLKRDKVGIHDNFFELGGHSLLATRVISRAHKIFEVEVPVRILFEHPTIAGLALQIAQAEARKIAPQEMANLLAALESLSDEEAERLLHR